MSEEKKSENVVIRIMKWFATAIAHSLLIVFIQLFIFIIIIAGIAVGVSKGSKPVSTISNNSYLQITIPNGMVEEDEVSFFDAFSRENKVVFNHVMETIKKAKDDSRIKGIIVDLDMTRLSLNHINDLNRVITNFKESGKKVYAFGRYIDNSSYLLAASADEIIMTPSASTHFSLKGNGAVYPYIKGFADKLGIKFNVIHIGDYKSFGENYHLDKMSEEFETELSTIIVERFEQWYSDLLKLRTINIDSFKEKILNGEFAYINGLEAKELGFIDGIEYLEDLKKRLESNSSGEISLVGIKRLHEDYKNNSCEKESDKKIGVLFLEGEIVMGNSSVGNDFGKITPSKVEKALESFLKDDKIDSIVLRINSPGGSSLASEIIHNKIARAASKKSIYVSIGSVAASGGYYISAAADKIFASEESITGSIGVVMLFPSFEKSTNKLSINMERIENGKYSLLGDVSRTPNKDEIELFRSGAAKIYEEFKGRVAVGRGMEMDEVEKLAQGRIWSGKKAKELGLIDDIANLDKVVGILAVDRNLEDYSVEVYVEKKEFKDSFMNLKSELIKSTIKKELMLGDGFDKVLEKYKTLKLISNEPALYLPYEVD